MNFNGQEYANCLTRSYLIGDVFGLRRIVSKRDMRKTSRLQGIVAPPFSLFFYTCCFFSLFQFHRQRPNRFAQNIFITYPPYLRYFVSRNFSTATENCFSSFCCLYSLGRDNFSVLWRKIIAYSLIRRSLFLTIPRRLFGWYCVRRLFPLWCQAVSLGTRDSDLAARSLTGARWCFAGGRWAPLLAVLQLPCRHIYRVRASWASCYVYSSKQDLNDEIFE